MRARSALVLSVAVLSGVALAGCASSPAETETPSPTAAATVESSYDAPAVSGDRVGVDGDDLQVWSSTVPDEAAAATLGDPAEGTQWVTITTAQWVAEDGQKDVDVAPVLRSTADAELVAEAASPRSIEVPMTAGKSYTFAWSFAVPEDLVDPAGLVVCTTADADAACSAIAAP